MAVDEEILEDTFEASQSTMPGLAELVWRRKSLLILGVVVGLIIGILVYLQSTPSYSSSAEILIIRKSPDVLPTAVAGEDRRAAVVVDYIATQVKLIGSPKVVRLAVDRLQQEGISSLPADADIAAEALMNGLTVEASEGNNTYGQSGVVIISYRGPNALDAKKIVNAIILAYQTFLEKTYESANKQATAIIEDAQIKIDDQLDSKEKAYQIFRQTNPLPLNSEGGASTSAQKLSAFEAKLGQLQLRQSDIAYQLGIIVREFFLGKSPRETLVELLGSTEATPQGNATLRGQLLELRVKENKLVKDYGNDYEPLIEIRELITLYEQELTGDLGVESESNEPAEILRRAMTRLQRESAALQQSIDTTNTLIGRAEKKVRAEQELRFRHDDYTKSIEVLRVYVTALAGKLQEINLQADSGGYTAEAITPPKDGIKVAPKMIQTLMIGCILGGLIGLGLAYITELTDKRFHAPDQIRKQLGLAVIGHLPSMKPDPKTLAAIAEANGPPIDTTLLTYHKPRSPMAEAFRGIRTAIYFGMKGANHKVIQMTSPMKGDGKSTTAANLAISIAQTGNRILLIDADMRRPQAHRLFGLKPTLGLEDVILGNRTAAEAILPSGVENLSILANGTRPVNPAELLTSPRFVAVLDQLRNEYDLIIIDTPPVLLVSDPAIVAPRVDGLLLVIRVGKSTKAESVRARNILAELDVNILGVLVNTVDAGSGKEGEYGYGYGYNYSYDYDAKSYGAEYGYGYEDPPSDDALEAYKSE